MKRILCTLPNASSSINGVGFNTHKMGMLSEPVEDDVAAHFVSIPGYRDFDEVMQSLQPKIAASAPLASDVAGAGIAPVVGDLLVSGETMPAPPADPVDLQPEGEPSAPAGDAAPQENAAAPAADAADAKPVVAAPSKKTAQVKK